MSITTRICISTSLLNSTRSFLSLTRGWNDEGQKYVVQDKILKVENETPTKSLARTVPVHPGNGSVPDPIGSPAERRKGGPQEEFIDVDPNFTEELPEEEKEELLDRARKENKKEN